MKYPNLIEASVFCDFVLSLKYDNGEIKYYDFSENFSHPFYAPLKNKALFSNVKVLGGTLEWATGQDFCPFTLYEKSTTKLSKVC